MIRRAALLSLPALLATEVQAQSSKLGGGSGVDVSFARVFAALIFCLMLAAVIALALKRMGGRVDLGALRALLARQLPERRIVVIEARRIGAHVDLCLVRCDDDEYLILSSAQAQQVLRQSGMGSAVVTS